MVLLKRLLANLIGLLFSILVMPVGHCETLSIAAGPSSTSVVSSRYKSQVIGSTHIQAAYSRELLGKWSLFGQYLLTADSGLSGITAGLTYDSRPLSSSSGSALIATEGSEVQRTPKWAIRYSLGIGIFRFANSLKSNDASLGNRNSVRVQADLYGFNFSVAGYRYFNNSIALFAGIGQVLASASGFGITSSSLVLGSLWKLD